MERRVVAVRGVGTSSFGRFPRRRIEELAWEAALEALDDAGAEPASVEAVFVGTVFAPSGTAARILRGLGVGEVPVLTLENACASGTTAYHEAVSAVALGRYATTLVIGVEQLSTVFDGPIVPEATDAQGDKRAAAGVALPVLHALSAQRYLARHGATVEQLAAVAVKNKANGTRNPRAQLRSAPSLDDVLASHMVAEPLTLLQCCPVGDGAGAAVVGRPRGSASEVEVLSSALVSGALWDHRSDELWGEACVARAAKRAFAAAAVTPADVHVAEVHDASTIGEVTTLEALGFCGPGEGAELAPSGYTSVGGEQPVNTSGGLLARGHPLGATGLAQLAEVVWQLRGEARGRQVVGAEVGLVETAAVGFGERRLSFAEAWDRGLRLANALAGAGLRRGDRVGVLEDNSIGAADFFCATAAANLVRVPLYPRNSAEAHEWMLGHTGCRALVVAERYASDVAGLSERLPALETVVVRDAAYEDWLASFPVADPDPPVDPDDPYVIRHTGGTTGRSKGVAYTHRAWLAAGRDWFYNFPPVELGDRCLHVGPISHGSGYFFTPIWLSGGSNVMLDSFEPEAALDVMEQEGIAYVFAVPTILNALARHPSAKGRDWSRLKVLQVGGSPVADDTALLARDVFGMVLYQGYGQTEALPATMMGPREWFSAVPGSNPLRSAGRPLPFAELEIRDPDTHAALPVGQEGEIAIRCDGQMAGFWENPAATAERLVDGWVLTGDIGRLDDNGYAYVLDRKDDMIISGGYNIWPAELENVLVDHPGVVEAAVFGVPDARWGETPLAVCVTDGATPVTEDEVIELCRARLGSYKKPSKVVLTTEPLPKSPVGKVQRKALREPYWAGRERRVSG